MKKIFKYAIPLENNVPIIVPAGARFLSLECVKEIPVVYFVTDPAVQTMEKYYFKVFGTGWEISDEEWKELDEHWWNLGVIQQAEGQLIWHVWMSDPDYNWRREHEETNN